MPEEGEKTETVMWGERGLVATLFQDLAADQSLARWNEFTGAIQPPLSGIVNKAWTVVEPDFHGFGHPDAVALLDFGEERAFWLLRPNGPRFGAVVGKQQERKGATTARCEVSLN